MYSNLRKELFAAGIPMRAVAELLKIGTNTFSHKMHGKTEFKASEMFAIQRAFFPTLTVDYLFETK